MGLYEDLVPFVGIKPANVVVHFKSNSSFIYLFMLDV
jgi:hypothetical protein